MVISAKASSSLSPEHSSGSSSSNRFVSRSKLFLNIKDGCTSHPENQSRKPRNSGLASCTSSQKRGPMLHWFQGALPRLPLPNLDKTMRKHLLSMKPILSHDEYQELEFFSERFRKGVGRRLQRYLTLKSWFSSNYVTDWWEEFVYMRQRSPIMINSNYYRFDTLNETKNQAAHAAILTYTSLQLRRMVDRQEVSPFSISPRTKDPFCTMQYERLLNSCRVPGEEVDRLLHWDDAKHVAVYCRGVWFKLVVHNGKLIKNAHF
ncbi:hypothetical protein GCK72_022738 [Caenorhabditis remanei]|uniref:Choline/carnitine acyltransferase domain-containing protein n=1 Tax=Caenorhabditis remanei TaxID=31234 RepID=A0A6A5FUV2_CAERE|nr:hypothetical protein GCK72_022738 [Caenorhabditis remanei]KAF1746285.1 hypothetical protein GCK72_022738 [Caenorhabditis remanei]